MTDLKSLKVLVTPTSYGKHNPHLRATLEAQVGDVIYNETGKPLSSEQLRQMLPGVAGLIAGLDTIDVAALAAADQLKVIARYGVGVDNVDLDAARERGIVVTNTPGANAASVAELTIGLMLALARNIPQATETTHAGEWRRFSGVSLEGKTIGLLGFGAIGKQVARRLVSFDCELIAYDPFVASELARAYHCELTTQAEVIARADFLSLHLPVVAETREIINETTIGQMKPGSYLINTARGELIDEAALLAALERGHIRGAALDAFTLEPPAADNPLLRLPQVIMTPHTGAHTDGATNMMGQLALDDCLAVLRGDEPRYRVV